MLISFTFPWRPPAFSPSRSGLGEVILSKKRKTSHVGWSFCSVDMFKRDESYRPLSRSDATDLAAFLTPCRLIQRDIDPRTNPNIDYAWGIVKGIESRQLGLCSGLNEKIDTG